MLVSINQPAYLPWPGYYQRISKADVHVVLDHVQFEKNSLVNRNRIKNGKEWGWLTLPVKTKGRFGNLNIDGMEISQPAYSVKKHWKTICQEYSGTPFFSMYRDKLEAIYGNGDIRFIDLIEAINTFFIDCLAINTQIIYSSELDLEKNKSELVLEICKQLDADQYLSGPMGRDYLNLEQFNDNEIQVQFHEFRSKQYERDGLEFIPSLSTLDLLMYQGGNSVAYIAD